VAVDDAGLTLGNNLSGAVWDASDDSLWVVVNGPSLLRRLEWSAATSKWVAHTGWSTAATLQYPGGSGQPDSEGVTLDATGTVLVSTERDNGGGGSRLSVLRYDVSSGPGTLAATNEWDLTATLAGEGVSVGSNAGLEAIPFLPDAAMTQRGLYDEYAGAPYDPSGLAAHLGGVVAVGVEGTADVFLVTLLESGGHDLVARIDPGLAAVMSLEYDVETGRMWAGCDNNCSGALHVLAVDQDVGPTQGRFVVERAVDPPTGLSNGNDEGFALGPSALGVRRSVWARDGGGDGSSLWQGELSAGPPCP
jgi:hypothetical protein